MAKSDAVWGIDIGQCALKALRCQPHEDSSRIVAAAFDYIEYPRILSQPDVDPVELIQDALKQFLSRNSVRGDRVVISVAGQNGLARFIKLPPVEAKRIPDIVKYEAKQQIPFALEDVVWDYQQMLGGSIIEGFAMETEVGLFAMKRDQVFRALKPFKDAGIEVDVVQLTPLALYNYVAFDHMQSLPSADEYDPDQPPESLVVLSLGTDSTDLVISNGFKMWQRSIPLGGNHFTKALTKELKLTFASAEHLKRNAQQAEDPKALFQAMRPIFSDLLTEVQRSIGYFSNLDRKAKISKVITLGNAMKLPGLQRYLEQNLGFELQKVEAYRGLSGTNVVDAPAFKENLLCFAVCYGLALQGLRDTKIQTNLLPREIRQERLIRAKKPWAVGAAAAILLGFSLNCLSHWRAWKTVEMPSKWEPSVKSAETVRTTADTFKSDHEKAKSGFAKTDEVGQSLLQNVAGRELWLKFMKAVSECLPRNPPGPRPTELVKRNEIKITSLECQRVEKLEDWYAGVSSWAEKEETPAADAATQPTAQDAPTKAGESNPLNQLSDPSSALSQVNPGQNTTNPPVDTTNPPADATNPAQPPAATGNAAATTPTGKGWVIQITGYHYHNEKNNPSQGVQYLRETLLHNLSEATVGDADVGKFGIGFPVLLDPQLIKWENTLEVEVTDLQADAATAPDGATDPADDGIGTKSKTTKINAPRFDFIIQFCWIEPPLGKPDQAAIESAKGQESTTQPAAVAAPNPNAAQPGPAETQPVDALPANETQPADTQPADNPEPGDEAAAEEATQPAVDASAPDQSAPGDAAPADAAPNDSVPADDGTVDAPKTP